MTTAVYEEYLSQKEWESYNRGRISEYARHHRISLKERALLLQWLLTEHSIDSNPESLVDQAGRPMDYIEYLRHTGKAYPTEPIQLSGEAGGAGAEPRINFTDVKISAAVSPCIIRCRHGLSIV